MAKKILMATRNPHKKERFQHYLDQLGLSVVNFADLDLDIEVVEDGKTPEENAFKKAHAAHKASKMPSFGVDYWFFIDGLADDKQPGPFVRRIFQGDSGVRVEATDEQMIKYYSDIVKGLGGKTTAKWVSAVGLVVSKDVSFSQRFTRKTILTSEISPRKTEGEPMNSLQIDPGTGKYFTDLAPEEWLNLQKQRELGYIRFFENHLSYIA